MRTQLSHKWIKGVGLGIGELHYPLPVLPGVSVTYVDLSPEKDHPDQVAVHQHIVDNAERLDKFGDETQDFVIANHVLEHCEDTLGTLETWIRVLKRTGIAFIALPLKDHCFDRRRNVTEFSHFWNEWKKPDVIQFNRIGHYMDWYQNSELELCDPIAAQQKTNAALAAGQNIHWHTYTPGSMSELFTVMSEHLGFEVLEGVTNGSECIWILRKK